MRLQKSIASPMLVMMLATMQPWMGMAWVVTRTTTTKSSLAPFPTRQSRRRIVSSTRLFGGPFFGPEEEFECPEEEECEIDWDKMPGFGDDIDREDTDNMNMEDEEERIDDYSTNPKSFAAQAMASMEDTKVRLEMRWQIEECETDEDKCDDFCEDCAGSGQQYCRFCRGTGVTTLGNDFRPCIICKSSNGLEPCTTCHGTGRIAPWAATMDKYMTEQQDEEEKKPI